MARRRTSATGSTRSSPRCGGCWPSRAELGEAVAPATVQLSDDPLLANYHAAALAPLGPADQYELLVAAGPEERVRRLSTMLADAEEVARLRLAVGDHAGGFDAGGEADGSGVDDEQP